MTIQEYLSRAGLAYDSTAVIFDQLNPHAHYRNMDGVYAYVRFLDVDCESIDVFIHGNEVLLVDPLEITFG